MCTVIEREIRLSKNADQWEITKVKNYEFNVTFEDEKSAKAFIEEECVRIKSRRLMLMWSIVSDYLHGFTVERDNDRVSKYYEINRT